MGKVQVARLARESNRRMPFKEASAKKPMSWKNKQRAYVFAGLRAMRAPAVRGSAKVTVGILGSPHPGFSGYTWHNKRKQFWHLTRWF